MRLYVAQKLTLLVPMAVFVWDCGGPLTFTPFWIWPYEPNQSPAREAATEVDNADPCRATAWKDLETKGFLVLPSFVTSAEIEQLQEAKSDERTKNPLLFELPPRKEAGLESMLAPILERFYTGIQEGTRFARQMVTTARPLFYCVNSSIEATGSWHVDKEFGADPMHSFGVAITLTKGHPEKAGLQVVPVDRLLQRGRNNRRFAEGQMILPSGFDFTTDRNYDLGFDDLNESDWQSMLCNPVLQPGDALVLRQDVFHRTAPIDNSFRCFLFARLQKTSLHQWLRGGLHKYKVLMQDLNNTVSQMRDAAIHENPELEQYESLVELYLLMYVRLGYAARLALHPLRKVLARGLGEVPIGASNQWLVP